MKFADKTLGYHFLNNVDMPKSIEMVVDPFYKNKTVFMSKEELDKKVKDENLVATVNGCFFTPHNKEVSIFSNIIS